MQIYQDKGKNEDNQIIFFEKLIKQV